MIYRGFALLLFCHERATYPGKLPGQSPFGWAGFSASQMRTQVWIRNNTVTINRDVTFMTTEEQRFRAVIENLFRLTRKSAGDVCCSEPKNTRSRHISRATLTSEASGCPLVFARRPL